MCGSRGGRRETQPSQQQETRLWNLGEVISAVSIFKENFMESELTLEEKLAATYATKATAEGKGGAMIIVPSSKCLRRRF